MWCLQPELIEESKLIYSAIPLPEGDSNIGRIARHERSKAFQDDSANDSELQVIFCCAAFIYNLRFRVAYLHDMCNI